MTTEKKLTEKIQMLDRGKPASFLLKDMQEIFQLYEEVFTEYKNKLGYADSYAKELEIENADLKADGYVEVQHPITKEVVNNPLKEDDL